MGDPLDGESKNEGLGWDGAERKAKGTKQKKTFSTK